MRRRLTGVDPAQRAGRAASRDGHGTILVIIRYVLATGTHQELDVGYFDRRWTPNEKPAV